MKGRPKTLRGSRTTTQKACGSGDGGNASSRIVSIAIVAAGLTFSASLYPLPGQWPILELWQAGHGPSPGLPRLIESTSAKPILDLATAELPTLVHLAQILEDEFPAVRADVLLTAVEKYGLPEVVRSLEVLVSSGLPTRDYAAPFGAGGGGPSAALPPTPSPEFAELLEMLMLRLPVYLIEGLSDVLAALFPALIGSAQVQHVAQILSVVGPTAAPGVIELPAPSTGLATPTAAPPPPAEPVSAPPEPATPPVQVVSAAAPEVPPPPPIIETPVSVAPTSLPEIGTIVAEAAGSLPIVPDLVGPSHDSSLSDSDGNQDSGSEGSAPQGAGGGTDGTDAGGTTTGGDDVSAGERPSDTSPRETGSDPSPDPSGGDRSGDPSGGAAAS